MRGESNINMLQEQQNHLLPGMMQTAHNTMPFQEKSIVFPFMQGLPDHRGASQNLQSVRGGHVIPNMQMSHPHNMVLSPR